MSSGSVNTADSAAMVCTACAYPINSFSERMVHYKTDWHRYNVKRRCVSLPPLTENEFVLKTEVLKKQQEASAPAAKVLLKCRACNKQFHTESAFEQHKLSKKHKKRAAQWSADNSTADDSQSELDVRQELDVRAGDRVRRTSQRKVTDVKLGQNELVEDDEEDEDEEDDDEVKRDVSEEDEEEEEEDDESQAIPLKQCLFCSKSFHSVPSSLDHMLKTHGFFIPFPELLEDLDGLLTYLGEKVGVGRICLWCNGRGRARYPTVRAVQQHMTAKSHCKIRLEEDEDDEEFIDFYNFPGTVSVGDEASERDNLAAKFDALILGKDEEEDNNEEDASDATASVSELGELVLPDGTRLGHRSLRTYYKQDLKPEPSRNDRLIRQLMSEYRAIQLAGFHSRDKKKADEAQTKFMRKVQRRRMELGVRANRMQTHFRAQVMF